MISFRTSLVELEARLLAKYPVTDYMQKPEAATDMVKAPKAEVSD